MGRLGGHASLGGDYKPRSVAIVEWPGQLDCVSGAIPPSSVPVTGTVSTYCNGVTPCYVCTDGTTISKCASTQQGQLCPYGAAACNTVYTCPLGNNYTCSNGTCTQPGICSSTQVPITQYQCPSSGVIYNDSATCSNNCFQTTACNAGSISLSGQISNGYGVQAGQQVYFRPNGNSISLIQKDMTTGAIAIQTTFSISGCTITGPDAFVGNTNYSGYPWNALTPSLSGAGNTITVSGYNNRVCWTWISGYTWNGDPIYTNTCVGDNTWMQTGWTVSGCTVSGSVNDTGEWGTLFYGSGNTLYPYYFEPRYGSGSLVFASTAYTCPYGSQYPCSGSPPSCTAPQSCVTYNGSIAKYQCSLTGTIYDTQTQCTGVCSNTANCSISYSCPIGNYTCMNNNGAYQCSPNQCIDASNNNNYVNTDTTQGANDNKNIGTSNGQCLGTLRIFSGKDNRCRIAGTETGWSNCCQKGDTWWGLGQCNSGEKQLGILRNWGQYNGNCHYVGQYCSSMLDLIVTQICLQEKQTYCCFDGPLPRIVQECVRPQLGISWGNPDSPNCRGLTMEEFQKINLDTPECEQALNEWGTNELAGKITNVINNFGK